MDTERTLRDLHAASGRTYREVLQIVRESDATICAQTPEAIAMLLRRGTDRLTLIRALARAWEVSTDEVEAAALHTRALSRAAEEARKQANPKKPSFYFRR